MTVQTILLKWKESLELFKGQEFYSFLLSTLNTFRRSLIILTKNFWYIFLIILVFIRSTNITHFISNYFHELSMVNCILNLPKTHIGDPLHLIYIFTFMALFYSFICARPSIENKNLKYFSLYSKKFFLGSAFFILFLIPIPIIPISWMVTLFYLDSNGSLKSFLNSIKNGFKIVIYFLPAFLILGTVKTILNYPVFLLLKVIEKSAYNYIFNPLTFLLIYTLWLLFLCAMSMYYIKIKHKDFNLFH